MNRIITLARFAGARFAGARFSGARFASRAALAGLLLAAPAAPAAAIETSAREALLIDHHTGAVLLEKNADARMPPASMSKIMTAYVAFRRLKQGSLSLDDKIHVSEKAWRKGGSKMFIRVNRQVAVADILRGIIVQSGNDAAIALAEALAGSEAAFAEVMENVGREIGLQGSSFRNATGWPDPEHRMTARDLATLASATIREFPEYYPIYAEKSFTYNKIKQPNRNPLLYRDGGGDGLKTGYTQAAGYGLTASAKRGDRRLILVVNGMSSVRARTSESRRLMAWGFTNFNNYRLFKKDETVERIDVWLGAAKDVALVSERDVLVTLPRTARTKMKVKVVAESPVPAPVAIGQRIATLEVSAPGIETRRFPLLAGEAVEKLGMFSRVVSAVGYLLWGGGG